MILASMPLPLFAAITPWLHSHIVYAIFKMTLLPSLIFMLYCHHRLSRSEADAATLSAIFFFIVVLHHARHYGLR
jgi:hypothetical protein